MFGLNLASPVITSNSYCYTQSNLFLPPLLCYLYKWGHDLLLSVLWFCGTVLKLLCCLIVQLFIGSNCAPPPRELKPTDTTIGDEGGILKPV